MTNQYSKNKYRVIPCSEKQKRQRKLAWALKIVMGFEGCLYFIPRDIITVNALRDLVKFTISEIKSELRNIK